MNVSTPNAWLKPIYISKRSSTSTQDSDGNEIFTYATPIAYRMNHQPISSETDIEMFGASSSQIQKVVDVNLDYTLFDEYDKVYLDGVTPTGESVVGANANYFIKAIRLQNLATVLYFQKLPGLANGRV